MAVGDIERVFAFDFGKEDRINGMKMLNIWFAVPLVDRNIKKIGGSAFDQFHLLGIGAAYTLSLYRISAGKHRYA
jgi:hypothetical protein